MIIRNKYFYITLVFMLSNFATYNLTTSSHEKILNTAKIDTFNKLLYRVQESCEFALSIEINDEVYFCMNVKSLEMKNSKELEDDNKKEEYRI